VEKKKTRGKKKALQQKSLSEGSQRRNENQLQTRVKKNKKLVIKKRKKTRPWERETTYGEGGEKGCPHKPGEAQKKGHIIWKPF